MNLGNGLSATSVAPTSVLTAQLQRLSEEQQKLEVAIGQLAEKLQPIRLQLPSKETVGAQPATPRSEVTNRVCDIADRIRICAQMIGLLTSEVEC